MVILPFLLAQSAVAASSAPQPSFHLVCHGDGQNQVATYSSSIFSLFVGSHTQLVSFDDDMRIDIEGAIATATIPGRFVAQIHLKKTTFDLQPLTIEDDAIFGKISINWANHPNFRINRKTGVIEMDGSLGNFTGKCEKYDPDQHAF